MGFLNDIGYAILCALGLVVFLVIMWFAIGIFFAMRDLYFKKRVERSFINHKDLMQSLKNKEELLKFQNGCSHVNYSYSGSHPDKPFTCKDCGKLI